MTTAAAAASGADQTAATARRAPAGGGTTVVDAGALAHLPADRPRALSIRRGPADLVFRAAARGGGLTVLLLISLIGAFLAGRAGTALGREGVGTFVTTADWNPGTGAFGIKGVLIGSILIALTAIFFALPMAFCMALYISEYAPAWLRQTLVSAVDLMAAVPSVVFGLWGFWFLQHNVIGTERWISTYFGWIPFLKVDGVDLKDPLASPSSYTGSTLIAGMVVALMVTPIATSVMRESFSQAPLGEREGAYALGATRWGMIRSVVLALRARRRHRRHDAGPGPGPGRDDRRLHDHLDGLHGPAAHPGEGRDVGLGAHRAALRRLPAVRDLGADGRRALPVRPDPDRELRRELDRGAQPFRRRERGLTCPSR